MTEKYIKDGRVAVAYSPGYGAGWSSWNTNMFPDKEVEDTLLFHPEIIKMILNGRQKEITTSWLVEHFGKEYENVYTGGAYKLKIDWVPIGRTFRIDEYDGSECIIFIESDKVFQA
jgi:hypothetical protein